MNGRSAAHDGDDAERYRRMAAERGLDDRERRWAALLDRIAAGDVHALGVLYDESSRLTFGLVVYILQDRDAAEDALVEVYTQVLEQAGSRRPEHPPVSWLIGLARHTALARVGRRLPLSPPLQPSPPPPPSAPPTMPFEPFHWKRQQIGRALEQLTPRQRSIIQMTYFGGLTAREIAGELELSTHQVMGEIQVAMGTLRNSLACADAG
jgi:RNA polymerase sigma-70 factor (ECF subfamily)